MGYQPFVIQKYAAHEVWGPAVNGRHSLWALDHFSSWVADQRPDVVHVNFGIHDASIQFDGKHQILLPQYKLCLQRFIHKVKALGNTRMIWATTTPLYTPEQGKPMAQWEIQAAAEIREYNTAALEIVESEGLPVNDLHEAVMRNDFTQCLTEDGCHMTEFGNQVLSDAVVQTIGTLM